eukprot:15459388-Alexandrium_andersonii.AAC.1
MLSLAAGLVWHGVCCVPQVAAAPGWCSSCLADWQSGAVCAGGSSAHSRFHISREVLQLCGG